jgi:hypothetical protein
MVNKDKNFIGGMPKILDIEIDVWCIPLSILFGVVVSVDGFKY